MGVHVRSATRRTRYHVGVADPGSVTRTKEPHGMADEVHV